MKKLILGLISSGLLMLATGCDQGRSIAQQSNIVRDGQTTNTISEAFGFKLGDQLPVGAERKTTTTEITCYVPISSPITSSVLLSALPDGRIYSIFADPISIQTVLQALIEKYGTPERGQDRHEEVFDWMNDNRKIHIRINTNTLNGSVSYEDLGLEGIVDKNHAENNHKAIEDAKSNL